MSTTVIMNNLIWKPLKYPMIPEGYLISNTGFIRNKDCDESDYLTADYHSSNGYDYILLIVKEEYYVNNSIFMLFPIDELLASAFIYIPEELTNKRITVKHIDGDTRNIELTNLEWIEDVEEWRECTYPGILKGRYEVSSWGRIKDVETCKYLISSTNNAKGYEQVYLHKDHSSKSIKRYIHTGIHRLMMLAFKPLDGDISKMQVNHINGIKTFNRLKNLEWVNNSTNQIHAYDTGLNVKTNRSLSENIVKYIWYLLIDEPSYLKGRLPTRGSPTIVHKYLTDDLLINISLHAIKDIKAGIGYRQITMKLPHVSFNDLRKTPMIHKKLTTDDVKLVWYLLNDVPEYIGQNKTNGSPNKVRQILLNMNINYISIDDIQKIKTKQNWKNVTDKL